MSCVKIYQDQETITALRNYHAQLAQQHIRNTVIHFKRLKLAEREKKKSDIADGVDLGDDDDDDDDDEEEDADLPEFFYYAFPENCEVKVLSAVVGDDGDGTGACADVQGEKWIAGSDAAAEHIPFRPGHVRLEGDVEGGMAHRARPMTQWKKLFRLAQASDAIKTWEHEQVRMM